MRRRLGAVLVLSLSLAACGARSTELPEASRSVPANDASSSARSAQPVAAPDPPAADPTPAVDDTTSSYSSNAATSAPESPSRPATPAPPAAATATASEPVPSESRAPSSEVRRDPAPSSVSGPAGLIHGTVQRDCGTDADSGGGCYKPGNAVAGVSVELRSGAGTVLQTARTDASGVFEFRVAPGRYLIREAGSGVSQERDVAAGRTTFVGLVVPSG